MKGFAALAIVAGFSSCVKDVDGVNTADQEKAAKENAELQLGLTIPEGQTWDMASQIEANVAVNLEAGETYEVAVYANDPIADGVGKVLAKGTVQGGKTYTTKFTGSKAAKSYVVGATDSKNFTRYTYGTIDNGHLVAKFGVSSAVASRSMRSIAVSDDPFTNYDTKDYYKTEIPEGAVDINTTDDQACINAHILKATSNIRSNLNLWMGPAVEIYVQGNVELPSNAYIYSATFYVLPNSTLTLNKQANYTCRIFVAESGILNYNVNKLEKNNDGTTEPSCIFSKGTVNLPDNFEANQGVVIYNEGSMIGKDITSKPADTQPSYFYNYGDLTLSGKMELNSCANFFNEGTVIVKGETSVTQQKIYWINKGHYTTNSMKLSANNSTFYNFCQLLVETECTFTDGVFNLMQNSYTECSKAIFNNSHINMGDNSTFYVKEKTMFGRQGQGLPQGFYAEDNDSKATVMLKGEAKSFTHKGAALHISGAKMNLSYESLKFYNDTYSFSIDNFDASFGNFYNETTKEALQEIGDERTTMEVHEGAHFTQVDDIDFTAPAEMECSATIEEDGKEKIEEPAPVTFAFEDQINNGDYDLNDVVLKVTPHVVKSGKKITSIDYDNLDIKLVAAGATFDITVMVDKTALSFNGKTEVHDAFGVNKGVMVNTGGTAKSGVQQNAAPVTCTIATPEDVKTNETDSKGNPILDLSKLNIWIDVNPGKKSAAQIYYLKEKTEPYAVMIPIDWAWPKERVCIKDAYLGSEKAENVAIDESGNTFKKNSFAVWAATLERDAVMNGWYNFPVEGSTMKNK